MLNANSSNKIEYKIKKNIEFFNLISEVYTLKRRHCLEILSNFHYVFVFQQTNRNLACMIFDQNSKIIKSVKIIDQALNHFISKLVIKFSPTRLFV